MSTLLEVKSAYDDMEALGDSLNKIAQTLEANQAHYDKVKAEWEIARSKWIMMRMEMIPAKAGNQKEGSDVS